MKWSRKQIILGAVGLMLLIGVSTGVPIFFYQKNNNLTLTFIYRAAIMLEHNFKRIYIDPYGLLNSYEKKPADAIFITHSHEDHLSIGDINLIHKSSTSIICPPSVAPYIFSYDPITVDPMEEGSYGKVSYQAFPMYTNNSIHPKENNWVGYILDFNGFTIFHTGDSDCIPEYTQLEGKIDVLLLPIYDSYNMMGPAEVNQTIHVIKPRYVIPIHYLDVALDIFIRDYVPYLADAIFLRLQLGESHTFKLSQET